MKTAEEYVQEKFGIKPKEMNICECGYFSGNQLESVVDEILNEHDKEIKDMIDEMIENTQKLFDGFSDDPINTTIRSALANKIVTLTELKEKL